MSHKRTISETCEQCGTDFLRCHCCTRRFCSSACWHASPGHHLPKNPYTRRSARERFWAQVDKTGDCWNWMAAISAGTGYGKMLGENRRLIGTHRFSWEIHFGPVASNLCVLHHCDNRRCVRPEHLFLGTRGDNYNDMVSKGRAAWQQHQTE